MLCRVGSTGELCWSVGTCVVASSPAVTIVLQCPALRCVGRRAGFSIADDPDGTNQGTSVKKEGY